MGNDIDGCPVDRAGRRVGHRSGTRLTSGFADRLRRLLRCKRGVAAVEFALAAPLLMGALVPVADLGIAFAKQQQVRQAVQAGAQYASSHPWDQYASAAIAGAVTAATPLSGITLSPSPYRQCGCPSGTDGAGGIANATCDSTCLSGQTAGYYVVVSAQLTYTPVLPYSLLGSSKILSAQSMIRVP